MVFAEVIMNGARWQLVMSQLPRDITDPIGEWQLC